MRQLEEGMRRQILFLRNLDQSLNLERVHRETEINYCRRMNYTFRTVQENFLPAISRLAVSS